ncbi:MAG: hypothetical protein JWL85_22 [Candidatus Saccharibacteria bacterium]|nr:hypothetical protein [Candidatus Saccharibacteria bacterium]
MRRISCSTKHLLGALLKRQQIERGITMLQIIKQFSKGKHLATLGLTTLALAFGLTVVAPAASASAAVNCRVFTPVEDFYEAGRVASKIYYVPGSSVSGCKDINVRNVRNLNVSGDYCATFLVQMFPTSGGSFYTNPKKVCSKDPDGKGPKNGPVVPIATNVINGTKYRVIYDVENLDWRHTFQIVD